MTVNNSGVIDYVKTYVFRIGSRFLWDTLQNKTT